MKINDVYPGKNHDHILILGTGPSVFYNLSVIRKHISQYAPTIVGINGCFHGLLDIGGKIHSCIDPDGQGIEIDATNIDPVLPHLLFSFLLRRDKNTVDGVRVVHDKDRDGATDLFKYFILKHKSSIIQNKTALLCPDDVTYNINHVKKKYGWKRYGQAKWKYNKYFEFRAFPRGYKRGRKFRLGNIKKISDVYDNGIKFKIGHGGEYLLAWVLAQHPKTLAIAGMCDFPNSKRHKLTRGWFWLDKKRVMPPQMASHQSVILKYISGLYDNSFHDLNWTKYGDN